MSYTSTPNGLFTYTITGVSDSTELAVIQSAFNKWDSICQIDTSRWGSSYSINVSYSIASLTAGILGGASLQTYNITQGTTYGNIMPYEGTIQLNSLYTATMLADTRTGGKTQYYYVVLHELGHILGIGPFWNSSSPIYAPITSYTDANDSTTKYYYTGTNAFNQYKSYLSSNLSNAVIGLPIEDNGGSGTAEVHPEEGLESVVSSDTRYINGIFHPGINEELMTGWMEGSPTDTPLSRVTLGFLKDMGYIVNYSDAESFSIIYTSMSFSDYRKQNKTISEMKSLGYTDTQILQDGYFNIIDLSLAGYTANQIMSAKISAGNFDMSWNNIVSSDLSYQFMSGGQPGMLYYSPVGRYCYANGLNYQMDNASLGTSTPHYKNGEFAATSFGIYATDTNTTMKPLTPGAHFVIDPSGNLNIGIHGQSFYAESSNICNYAYEAWCNTIDASTGLYMHYKGGRVSFYHQFDRTTGVIYNVSPGGERISNDYLAGNTSTEITKYNRIMYHAGTSGALANGVLGDIGYGSGRNSAKHPSQDYGSRNSLRQFITGGKQWVIDNSHNSYFCSDNTSGVYGQSIGSYTFSAFGGPQISMLWQADPDHNSELNMGPYHYNRLARAKFFQIEIENGKFTVNGISQNTIRADVGHTLVFYYYDFHETGYTFSISSTNDGTHNSGTELSTSDGLTAATARTNQQNNAYINNDFNIYERDFTPTTAGTYYYYCPEAAGYGGTIIIDASGASQEGYQDYDQSTGLHALFRGDYTDTNGKGAVTTPSGMIVRKHGNDGHVLWYTSWNNADGSSLQNHIQINDVTRAGYKSNIRNPVSNWTLDIDITTTFTEISNHYGVYLYDSFFDSSDNLILGGSVMTTTLTNGQYTYYSLLMRVAVDDVSGSLRAYKLQQIPNLIQENSTSSHKHGWSTGVRTMFDKNHNYLVATPYNVDASYGVSVYKFDSSFNLDTTYGVDGSFNSIYTPYYKQNTNTGNNFMFGSRTEASYSDDNNNQIVGATAYDSTDDSLYIIGAGDNPTTSSADHNFVSIIKLDNTGNYDASFSSIYGAAGQLDIVDVIEKKTGASGTTHDGYTTYFGSSARNSILCPTAAIIRENALFIACSGHTAPYNGIYILKLKLSNTPDVRDLSNINFTLSDFQSSGYTDLTELKKIPYPLTDYKTAGFSAANMLSAFSVQETLSAGFSSQEILDLQIESFLQEDFATFDAANKFKESYMKTFLDVSGDIRLDSNYTAIFNAFRDASANEIKNILRTNTLDASYIIHDLSVNQHLFVQNDISLNKKMFIAGDLSVNGTLQFPDNSLSENDFTDSFDSAGTNQFNYSNSQIKGTLDISGLEFYVAGDVTVVDKDFQVEGNTYANNFINDELDNVIMEDDSLINRLDLSNNAFSVSKIYYDSSYSNIAGDFSYNAVPFISDNGKNICYPVHDINGTTNSYNTLYSNNHGTSFIDMATRLGGTAGSTNTKGLLNFYTTENQKYIYGYHNSEGIKRSDNYGYSFTDISMVNIPNSDLSYCVGLSSTNSAFDTTHSNLIASSASGKHVYMGGFKPYVENGPQIENITVDQMTPKYNWDFRQASTTGISERVSGSAISFYNGAYSTVSNGLILDGTDDYAESNSFDVNFSGTVSFEFYMKYSEVTLSETLFSLLNESANDGFQLTRVYNTYVDTGKYIGNTSIYAPSLTNAQALSSTDYDPRYNHLNNWIDNGSLGHYVIVYNATTGFDLYKNGSLHSSWSSFQSTYYNTPTPTTPNVTNVNRKFKIGTNSSTSPSMELLYFRVYESTLSASQVSTLYNGRSNINLFENIIDYGHFLIKSSDFGQTMNFDLSASAINMVTHQNSDLSFNSMIGSRHVSCSADGKYVICSVHGFTPEDDLNIVSATDSSANWYPVLSRDYGTNWNLLTSETFNDYHLLDNTDLSFNTSNSLNNCVGTAVSKTGKYVACAFNSATSIPKPIMFYLSSDYGKTFDLKANLELDTYSYYIIAPTYDFDFRQASTTSITDSIGGLTATYNGGMSSTVSDGAIFDGTDDYISFSPYIDATSGFSVEWYFNQTSVLGTIGGLFDLANDTTWNSSTQDNILVFGSVDSGPILWPVIAEASSHAYFTNRHTISNSTWYHCVLTSNNSGTATLYVDGTQVLQQTGITQSIVSGTRTSSVIGGSANLAINGTVTFGGEARFNGKVKYLRIFNNKELTSSEITTLYNNTVLEKVNVNDNFSNGLQISLSSNAETISLVSTKSASKVYSSSDYGTTWNTKSIALSNDLKDHYSQISSNSQYLVRNITSYSGSNNYYHSKLCKQITPYEKTYYTHIVKDFSNISNGNSSADSSITYSGGILTASDYRLKSNVQQLQDETVDNLQPVKFTFKNSQQETFGLIAHELEENYPFLVDGEKDGSHYQTVNYNGLLGVLVHELQLIRKGLEEYE